MNISRLTRRSITRSVAVILSVVLPGATGQSTGVIVSATKTIIAANPSPPVKMEPPGKGRAPSGGVPVYKPPDRGAPLARVGGGTRSPEGKPTTLELLVPRQIGLTISGQPTLFWYVSKPIAHVTVIRVTSDDQIEPVDEIVLNPPIDAGIHSYRLVEPGIVLKAGRRYQWGVEVLSSSERPSQNSYAGSWIMRTEPSDDLRTKLVVSNAVDRASALAEDGIWYDALAELSRRVGHGRYENGLRDHRAALLEQVGLTEVAAFERGRAPSE